MYWIALERGSFRGTVRSFISITVVVSKSEDDSLAGDVSANVFYPFYMKPGVIPSYCDCQRQQEH